MPGASIPTAATPSASSTPKPTSKTTTSSKPTTKAPTPAAPVNKSVNGTFTGSAVDVGYGTVQVKITVVNGKITDAQAVQAPSGRNDRYTNMSVPVLRQRTLTAQSANINGVSGCFIHIFWLVHIAYCRTEASRPVSINRGSRTV
jgi:uncharacterized protein with FMN-binding domain